jgi:hypothetical protein
VTAARSSFRDPFGAVFVEGSSVFRSIFEPGLEDYRAARDQGVFDELIRRKWLQRHEEVDTPPAAPAGTAICLQHPPLPFISYPWEWPFSLLRDAALLHLDVMEWLVPRGFWLRDASAFNVQFDGRGPLLIDTLSIGRRQRDSPWIAYAQFCSHFLAPLALAAKVDTRLLGLWRNYIDGFPLDLAVGALPRRVRYRPGLLMHLTLHSKMQASADRRENLGRPSTRGATVGDNALIGLIRSLRSTIEGLRPRENARFWDAYGSFRTYNEADIRLKTAFVEGALENRRPRTVWDLGANTGEFSRLAARSGAFVVGIDGDPTCIDRLYRDRRGDDGATLPILPLVMDLANPSPALGWNHEERPSLAERGPADLALALAILHHLVLSSNVPMARVAEWLARLASSVVLEFVPPSDPMAARLIRNRRGEHLRYDLETFRDSFAAYFEFEKETHLENGRLLFLLART